MAIFPSIWDSKPTIAVSTSSLPSLRIDMPGDRHWAAGITTGTGGGVVSAVRLMVTTAPVSEATALKEILPL